MITPDEFVTRWKENRLALIKPDSALYWGSEELVRFDPEVLEGIALPTSSKRFLIEAGLPRHAMSTFRFDVPSDSVILFSRIPQNSLPPLTWIIPDISDSYGRYRILGTLSFDATDGQRHYFGFICIDEPANGTVVDVIIQDDYPVHFMNSSIPQLAEYLLILRDELAWKLETHPRPEERIAHGNATIETLRRIDPLAVEEEDGVWSGEILDLESGA